METLILLRWRTVLVVIVAWNLMLGIPLFLFGEKDSQWHPILCFRYSA
jgi:hypothetical protein